MVSGEGELVTCSLDERPDLLRAGQVSLGALGIVTRITLQLEPPSLPLLLGQRIAVLVG